MAKIDKHGREVLSNIPLELPLDCHHPRTLQEEMARFLNTKAARIAAESGHDTFEDDQDFDVEDDPFPPSDHELDDDYPDVYSKEHDPREKVKEDQRKFDDYLKELDAREKKVAELEAKHQIKESDDPPLNKEQHSTPT